MKKLILGLAVTASSLAFAQQTSTGSSTPVSFGIKGGMNVSSLSKSEGLDDNKSKIGFNAGVFANIPLAESFSVQPEVLYSQYGSKSKKTYQNSVGKYEETFSKHLDYIAVPVMFQYKFVPNFYLEAGPEFGFMVGAKNKGDRTLTTNNSTSTTSYNDKINKDNLNTFNFGIGLGAGYYFTDSFGVTARYVAGLTDAFKNHSGNAIKNNVFQVGLAFKFK